MDVQLSIVPEMLTFMGLNPKLLSALIQSWIKPSIIISPLSELPKQLVAPIEEHNWIIPEIVTFDVSEYPKQ